MTISLIGLPGAGKTTLCRSLAKHLGWHSFLLGEALRARAETDATLQAILDRGELAPESVAIDLIKEAALTYQHEGLIIDGFPRHREQIDVAMAIFHPWIMLSLDVEVGVAADRIANRLSCSNCGWIGSRPSAMPTNCPCCGAPNLRKRAEDEPGVLSIRLTDASARLGEMIQYLPKVPVIRLDASLSCDQVLANALAALEIHFPEQARE